MMGNNETNEVQIDFSRIIAVLWKYVALILIVGILFSAAFFFYAQRYIAPTYQANVLLYVNNNSINLSSTLKITTSDLNAASNLVDTYVAILQSRATMEQIAEESGVDYSYEKLVKMVSAAPVNSTGLFRINVTSSDPEEARNIANIIAGILPQKIIDVMSVGNVVVVDYAVTPRTRVSPNYFRSAALGLLIGIVLASAVVILLDMLNDVINDEDYLIQTYDAPILATIPDLTVHSSNRKYGYGYGYANGYEDANNKAKRAARKAEKSADKAPAKPAAKPDAKAETSAEKGGKL